MKEKAMAKLQCDRLQSRVDTLETQVKQASRSLTSAGGASVPGTRGGTEPKAPSPTKTLTKTTDSRASVLPPDDRPNPFLGVELGVSEAEKFGEKKSFPAHMSSISAVCAHPSKPVVATASDDCTWKMWSIPNGDLIMTGDGHKDWISGLDFHPRGSHLATASGDGTVKLWSFAKSKCVATYTEHSQAVWSCMFHDGGDFIVSGSMDHTCKLWDVNTGRCRMSLRGHVDSVNSVCFQPFSNNICSSSGDKTVSLWDARSGLCIQTLYGHSNSCNSAAFNLRGDTIVSSDADGGVRIWDIRMVQQRLHIDAGPLPANKYLLTTFLFLDLLSDGLQVLL
jgi:WD40 repeat protein